MAYIQPTPLDPEYTRSASGGVFDDFELGVFAFRHDVLTVHFAIRY